MPTESVHIEVRSPVKSVRILDIQGVMGDAAREALFGVFEDADRDGARTLILNLGGLDAIEPQGVSLLLELQARSRQQKQRLLAYGLAPSLERIFALTQLDEGLGLYPDEDEALASA